MKKYLIVRVLEQNSAAIVGSYIYGQVELRSYKADYDYETQLFEESATEYGLNYDQFALCARIATIVDALDTEGALAVADNRFTEILDLVAMQFPISRMEYSNIGLVKELESGDTQPIQKESDNLHMMVQMRHSDIQQRGIEHYILSDNNELGSRLQKSLYWSRKSNFETNRQLKILFLWFSMEALFKESESDIIDGLVRWFLGFPNGKDWWLVSESIKTALESKPTYKKWKTKIVAIVEKIRFFRNDSVHAGYRSFDFTEQQLKLYLQIMQFSASRCQGAVYRALILRIDTLAEFKEFKAIIFEGKPYLVDDVHGTILYTLEQLDFKQSDEKPV